MRRLVTVSLGLVFIMHVITAQQQAVWNKMADIPRPRKQHKCGKFSQEGGIRKNRYIRTLNFEVQATVGSYLIITNSNIMLFGL